MFHPLTLTAVLGWLSLPPVLWRLRRGVRGTSLSGAWSTLAIAWLAWGMAGSVTLIANAPVGTVDLLWYSVAVVMLVPPIAVLGARRPIDRVWPWFVLLPLLGIFAWPVLSAFGTGKFPVTWNIEEPVLVGYALVLVMGAGNYIGLRYTLPALLWIAALVLLVGPLCPATARMMPAASVTPAWSMLLLTAAAWLATQLSHPRGKRIVTAKRVTDGKLPMRQSEFSSPLSPNSSSCDAPPPVHGGIEGGQRLDPPGITHPFNQVWLNFRDNFGIVWARRVQERFNDLMRQQGVSLRLGIHGLEPASVTTQFTHTELEAAEKSLRWLLQKFVDPEWIDARIPRTE